MDPATWNIFGMETAGLRGVEVRRPQQEEALLNITICGIRCGEPTGINVKVEKLCLCLTL